MLQFILLVFVAILLAGPDLAAAQSGSLSGWFNILWGDGPPGLDRARVRYMLTDDQGWTTELLLDERLAIPSGGVLALNRKRVRVVPQGEAYTAKRADQSGAIPVLAITFDEPESLLALKAEESALSGSKPWVTVLCRFADSTDVTPHDVSWFQALMGPAKPGMDHYWREVSYNTIDLTGSVVVGWYNLPQPRSYYVYDSNGDGKDELDFERATADCTAAADSEVFFPSFSGINLVFNGQLDGSAWGGSRWLGLDGPGQSYGITWLPPWAYNTPAPLAHEMGHGFGLPHSSGPYGQTFDSAWDVMSKDIGACHYQDPTYGCVPPHTIAYHKDFLGWIPASRVFVPTSGSTGAITIERLAQPTSEGNFLMAKIPIGGSATHFYTVEARRFVGYDVQVPGEAIVIHEVDTTRGIPAQVVDSDANGDPNDQGAMWTPGKTFGDAANGITVAVETETPTAFTATIAYTPATFHLTAAINGSGTVTSTPLGISCPTDCDEIYASGTSVVLTPMPAGGWVFTGWGGACSGAGACAFSMTMDQSVTATFSQTFTLTVTKAGSGSVTSAPPGIDCGPTCSAASFAFDSGTSVTLTAAPALGSAFIGWSGEGCSGTGTCTVSMTQARNVTATFTQPTFTLTVWINDAGLVSVTPLPIGCGGPCSICTGGSCSWTFPAGTTVTLTASRAFDRVFVRWGQACLGFGTDPVCVVSMTSDQQVFAFFQKIPVSLGVIKRGTGSGTVTSNPPGIDCGPTCSASFPFDTFLTLTATPDAGSIFTGWNHYLCPGTIPTCSFFLDGSGTLTATFTSQLPTLTLIINQESFHTGDALTLAATVTPGATPATVDAYVALAIPGGTLLFLKGDGSLTTEVRAIVANWPVSSYTGPNLHSPLRRMGACWKLHMVCRVHQSGDEPLPWYDWTDCFRPVWLYPVRSLWADRS